MSVCPLLTTGQEMTGLTKQHPSGPIYTKHQRQYYDNSAMTLTILFSLKSVELLENRLQSHSEATPLFSMRTESQALSLNCRSVDADAWCKWALTKWGSRASTSLQMRIFAKRELASLHIPWTHLVVDNFFDCI